MYVPILKNRPVEVGVLKDLFSVPLSNNTIPMIEVIQKKVQTNSKYDFFEIIDQVTNRECCDNKYFVDIVKRNAPSRVIEPVRTFLTSVTRDPDYYLKILKNIEHKNGLIPIVSYNKDWLESGLISSHAQKLREDFDQIGFRIFPSHFDQIYVELSESVNEGDFILLDIDNSSHVNPLFKEIYNKIKGLKDKKNIKTIILNSTKEDTVTNVSLTNGEPIFEIDNSLRDLYDSSYKFDGFGDYSGIVNSLPTSGGGISPAGIFYSKRFNCFVGFRRSKSLSEFEDFIAPEIMKSEYWEEYSEIHHKKCPGCIEIKRINSISDPKQKKGKSQAKWKGITMSHYIYSIDEWLSER